MTTRIDDFRGAHAYLSNFFYEADGLTIEHRFQAAKATSEEDHHWILSAKTPNDAKRIGRRIDLRADWEQVKDQVMLDLVREKFATPSLGSLLIATGDAELVEGNTWGDRYWGVDRSSGIGLNRLGQTLMVVRGELRGVGAAESTACA